MAMEADERLRWMEARIVSSIEMRRNDDIRAAFSSETSRRALLDFCNDEDARVVFVYRQRRRRRRQRDGHVIASANPPSLSFDDEGDEGKAIAFLKNEFVTRLAKETMDEDVVCHECSSMSTPLQYLELVLKDIYIPLFASNFDRTTELLHKLARTLQVVNGQQQGNVVLAMPCIDLKPDVGNYKDDATALVYILESAVVGWIKQIKTALILRLDFGKQSGPLDELNVWVQRQAQLGSIAAQLSMSSARSVCHNLFQVKSTYASSFDQMRREIDKAFHEADDICVFLATLSPWFARLYPPNETRDMMTSFPSLLHTVFLVWQHSEYYHAPKNFQRLLRLIANQIVTRASDQTTHNLLADPDKAHVSVREALKVCAKFRGFYLDQKEKADALNAATAATASAYQDEAKTTSLSSFVSRRRSSLLGGETWNETAVEVTSKSRSFLSTSSPWPQRNGRPFRRLNLFIERCNDVLDLVQTVQHFRQLHDAAQFGGLGTGSLDGLVRDVHDEFLKSAAKMEPFATTALNVDGKTSDFEKRFFEFRSTIKDLEVELARVLQRSLDMCPTFGSRLRLVEVFQGVCSREAIRNVLSKQFQTIVPSCVDELNDIKRLLADDIDNFLPPLVRNIPPIAGKLFWLHCLKERALLPVAKVQRVLPCLLEAGDGGGSTLRHLQTDVLETIARCEGRLMGNWQMGLPPAGVLTAKLKEPLLKRIYTDDTKTSSIISVNLSEDFVVALREARYLLTSSSSFDVVRLPDSVRAVVKGTDVEQIRKIRIQLDIIAYKYNEISGQIEDIEKPLFEAKLNKIEMLLEEGLTRVTWRSSDVSDFIEAANALICADVYRLLRLIRDNWKQIVQVTSSWKLHSVLCLFDNESDDVVTVEQLSQRQKEMRDVIGAMLVRCGRAIRALVADTLDAVQISEASPAWKNYLIYVDELILKGIRDSVLTSLKSISSSVENGRFPVLSVNVELGGNETQFVPPLVSDSANKSLLEYFSLWLDDYMRLGRLIKPLTDQVSYDSALRNDAEINSLIETITSSVEGTAMKCQTVLETFEDYRFLWNESVEEAFSSFLLGKRSSSTRATARGEAAACSSEGRAMSRSEMVRSQASARSSHSESFTGTTTTTNRPQSSLALAGIMGFAERPFLTRDANDSGGTQVPLLDDFDAELAKYKKCHDSIKTLPTHTTCEWLYVELSPLKHFLAALSTKWMYVFANYLREQALGVLNGFQSLVNRVEPQIDAVTGEETETSSFMHCMRIFSDVDTHQQEMDAKFVAVRRTVTVLEKYGYALPDDVREFYRSAPQRWATLRKKVVQAKQRIGPRIQAEAETITKDLLMFGELCQQLYREFAACEAFVYGYSVEHGETVLKTYAAKLKRLEHQAEDLMQLQELLETAVVNFNCLRNFREEVNVLRHVWTVTRSIEKQQASLKRQKWQMLDMNLLVDVVDKQFEEIRALPQIAYKWDVWIGLERSVLEIHATLPLIEALRSSALRSRHWKQLVRLTAATVRMDSNALSDFTLGQLLRLGLHEKSDDVNVIVQRAQRDVTVEMTLKTFEEVWLSRSFDLNPHRRLLAATLSITDAIGDYDRLSGSGGGLTTSSLMRKSMTRMSASTQRSRGVRDRTSSSGSATTLPVASGHVKLISNAESIFEIIESHQSELESLSEMTATGSFNEAIAKWKLSLQTVEAVLSVWLEVQTKWAEMEEAFTSDEVRSSLFHDAYTFSLVDRDFRGLMRSTVKNSNVLQCTSKDGVLSRLEKLNSSLTQCRDALLKHFEGKRQLFPRFYFIAPEDLMHVVCQGADPALVNEYISKLFPRIESIVLDRREVSAGGGRTSTSVAQHAVAFIGLNGEKVELTKSLALFPPVESWLESLRESIQSSLRQQLESIFDDVDPPLTFELLCLPCAGRASEIDLLAVQIRFRSLMKANESKRLLDEIDRASNFVVDLLKKGSNALVGRESLLAETEVELEAFVHPVYVRKLRTLASVFSYLKSVVTESKRPFVEYRRTSTRLSVCVGGEHEIEYGFEYQGDFDWLTMTETAQACISSLAGAVVARKTGLCIGEEGCGKTHMIRSLARLTGRFLNTLPCNSLTGYKQLIDLLKGVEYTGYCWLCLENIDRLSDSLLSSVGQRLSEIGSSSTTTMFASFATTTRPAVSTLKKIGQIVPMEFITIQFVAPNVKDIFCSLLQSNGFLNASSLSQKIANVYQLCANVLVRPNVSEGNSNYVGFYAIGIRLVRHVIIQAKSLKDQLVKFQRRSTKASSPTQDNASKQSLQLDIDIQSTDSCHSVDDDEEGDDELSLELESSLEERAVVVAIRDVFLPRLGNGDDDLFIRVLKTEFSSIDLDEIMDYEYRAKARAAAVTSSPSSEFEQVLANAMISLNLEPSVSFLTSAVRLSQLVNFQSIVCVVGPAGSGKTSCVRSLARSLKDMGRSVHREVVFSRALEPCALFGYWNDAGDWHDGLLGDLLRKTTKSTNSNSSKWIVLDGELNDVQLDTFRTMLDDDNGETILLPNNDRIRLQNDVKIFWELESLRFASPSVVSRIGVVAMNDHRGDVDSWRLYLSRWLADMNSSTLIDMSLFVTDALQWKRSTLISVTPLGAVSTLCSLMDALFLLADQTRSPVSEIDYRCLFSFAFVWAFGGFLKRDSWPDFDEWWRSKTATLVPYPQEGTVFDYFYDVQSSSFVSWKGSTATAGAATAAQSTNNFVDGLFVQTRETERLMYLLGLLSDVNCPVMLCGEMGSGKTSVVREHLKTICSGDVSDVVSVTLNANRVTRAQCLWRQIEAQLEWKSGRNYVPRSNKKLVGFVDDLHLSGSATLGEIIRQMIDVGGVHDPDTLTWKTVHDASFIGTCAPPSRATSIGAAPIGSRLLRHFAVLVLPSPSGSDLLAIFSSLLRAKFDGSAMLSRQNILDDLAEVTVELHDRLKTLYVPTKERCHYVFTTRDAGKIFSALARSLKRDCSVDDLLRRWRHECEWVYGRRLSSEVDYERYQQLVATTLRKHFANEVELSALLDTVGLYSDSIDEVNGRPSLQQMTTHASRHLAEYNASNSQLALQLYPSFVKLLSRLMTILRSPLEHGNVVLVGEGSPVETTPLFQLVAQMTGMTVTRIRPRRIVCYERRLSRRRSSDIDRKDLARFQKELINIFQRAGLKNEKILIVFDETDLVQNDELVFASDLLGGDSSISPLFTKDERTTIVNSIRPDVTGAGLVYSETTAWNYFLKKVKSNVRMAFIVASGGLRFQELVIDHRSLFNRFSVIWLRHWSKDTLVQIAHHHLNVVNDSSSVRENVAHLLASMHLAVRRAVGIDDAQTSCDVSGPYRHLNNSTYVQFLRRFVALVSTRYRQLDEKNDAVSAALKRMEAAADEADRLRRQIRKERDVVDEKVESAAKFLAQIGQDAAIKEELVKMIAKQEEKISQLEKTNPELRSAYEKAVDSANYVGDEARRLVAEIASSDLTALRAMQDPPIEVEDVVAATIVVVKSARYDLSWEKGGKRILASLDRFIELLVSFDCDELSSEQIGVADSYIQKPTFSVEYVTRCTDLKSVGLLCAWVRSAVRYHAMMRSRVKPLRAKCGRTLAALETNRAKLESFREKVVSMNQRLAVLNESFEMASVEKVKQAQLTAKMEEQMTRAQLFARETADQVEHWRDKVATSKRREASICGSSALAVALAVYLAPFSHFEFRRKMLVDVWPACLAERGINLMMPGVDSQTKSNCFVTDYDLFSESLAAVLTSRETIDHWKSTEAVAGVGVLTNRAIMSSSGTQWPFLLDFHGVGAAVVRQIEDSASLVVVDEAKVGSGDSSRLIETALVDGDPVLIDDVGGAGQCRSLDSTLLPLIFLDSVPSSHSGEGTRVVKFCGRRIKVHSNFRLYFATRSSSFSLTADLASRVTFVNFSLTSSSMKEYIRPKLFRLLFPSEAQKKSELVMQLAECTGRHKRIDEELVDLLVTGSQQQNENDILADEEMIANACERVSKRKECKLEISRLSSDLSDVDSRNEKLQALVNRASLLFLLLCAMKRVRHECLFDVNIYFEIVLESAAKLLSFVATNDDSCLISFTKDVFNHYKISFCTRHRLAFAFELSLQIMGEEDTTRALINLDNSGVGGDSDDTEVHEGIKPDWLNEKTWLKVKALAAKEAPFLLTFLHKLADDEESWRSWFNSDSDDDNSYLFDGFSDIQILLLYRLLRPDRFIERVKKVVKNLLDLDLTTSSSSSHVSFDGRPLLFVVENYDETNSVMSFVNVLCQQRQVSLQRICLGEGMTSEADRLMETGEDNQVILIENLHLSSSSTWLNDLPEKIADSKSQVVMTTRPTRENLPDSLLRLSRIVSHGDGDVVDVALRVNEFLSDVRLLHLDFICDRRFQTDSIYSSDGVQIDIVAVTKTIELILERLPVEIPFDDIARRSPILITNLLEWECVDFGRHLRDVRVRLSNVVDRLLRGGGIAALDWGEMDLMTNLNRESFPLCWQSASSSRDIHLWIRYLAMVRNQLEEWVHSGLGVDPAFSPKEIWLGGLRSYLAYFASFRYEAALAARLAFNDVEIVRHRPQVEDFSSVSLVNLFLCGGEINDDDASRIVFSSAERTFKKTSVIISIRRCQCKEGVSFVPVPLFNKDGDKTRLLQLDYVCEPLSEHQSQTSESIFFLIFPPDDVLLQQGSSSLSTHLFDSQVLSSFQNLSRTASSLQW